MFYFSHYNSVRHVLGTTLFLAGLSLVLSQDLRAHEPSNDPAAADMETKPSRWIEEARIIRQNPDPLLSWDRGEEPKLNQYPREEPAPLKRRNLSTDVPNEDLLTVVATSMGTAGGLAGGYIGGVAICTPFTDGQWAIFECMGFDGGWLEYPVTGVVTVLAGIGGGYFGYKNKGAVVTVGGGILGVGVGMALCLSANTDDILIPVALLSAGAGGYLGHRIWKVRESSGTRYSFSPYWDQENSGVMVFGEF